VAELAAATAPNLAVVTHGLVCASLATRVLRLEAGRAGPLAFANTALTIVDAAPPWRVRLLACTAHLA
jgi:broad specificity phosphatase PhoE